MGILLVWALAYEIWINPAGVVDQWLTTLTTQVSVGIMKTGGLDIAYSAWEKGQAIYIDGNKMLRIGHNCNGLILWVIFIAFLVGFPGRWKNKFWFIPAGIVVIFLANVGRVIALILIRMWQPGWLDFNHKYTFTLFVYGIIFLLWFIWAKRSLQNDHIEK